MPGRFSVSGLPSMVSHADDAWGEPISGDFADGRVLRQSKSNLTPFSLDGAYKNSGLAVFEMLRGSRALA